jgi:S-adenosylmethionine:tRNA ribosyltransferase-isomerase
MFSLSDYDYTLPDSLIAQHPILPPENARLLVFDRESKSIRDNHFYDLPKLLTPGTRIISRNTGRTLVSEITHTDIM